MARRLAAGREQLKADAKAKDMLLREVLPRLLRASNDPDATGNALLTAIERRLNEMRADDHNEVRALARQIVDAATRAERAVRLAALGTDGTP